MVDLGFPLFPGVQYLYVVRYRYIQVRTGSKVVLKAVQVQYRVAVVQGGRCTGYTKLN